MKKHESTQLRSLDAWLRSAAGGIGDALALSAAFTPKSQTAEQLIEWALGFDERVAKPNSAESDSRSGQSFAQLAQAFSHNVVRPDTTGTECDRRERTQIANHATKLNESGTLAGILKQLAQSATSGASSDALFETVNSDALRGSPLFPLLTTGDEFSKAIAGHVNNELLMAKQEKGAVELDSWSELYTLCSRSSTASAP